MQILRDRKITEDCWQYVAEDAAVSHLPEGDIIVPLTLWQTAKTELLDRQGRLGLSLEGDANLDAIAPDLRHFTVIALRFPAFRDGRGYSLARSLRQHYDYKGELRAIGNVLRDQIALMERVGFDAFAIDPKQDISDALKAFDEIKIKYQASSDDPLPLFRRRQIL